MFPGHMEVVIIVKNHYIDASQMSSKKEYSVGSNGVGNLQEINVLRIALKKTPIFPQEGRLMHSRKACSRTKKGMVCYVKGHGLYARGTKNVDKGRGG